MQVGRLIRGLFLVLASAAPFAANAVPIPGFNPAPTAPGTVLTNEPYTATACFANLSGTPTDVGYQPTLQVVAPAGSTLASASYLGSAQTVQTIGTCNVVAGCPAGFVNPDTGLTVPLTYQQSLAIVRMTLGSFPPALPPACVNMGFNLGDPSVAPLGVSRNIAITPIFSLGADPLNNPATDPAIRGTTINLGVTPSLMTLAKTIAAPESETATGPNYPRTFTLTLNVANGQTLTNVDITDALPGTLQYLAGSAVMTGCGGAVANTSTPGATPGGTLTRTCATVTGTLGGSDLVLTFQAYVPQLDAGAVAIVTPGAPVNNIVNTGTANGTYAGGPVTAVSPSANLAAKIMTLRKTAALVVDPGGNGVSPGDTLEYTLTFNLSDYFATTLVGPNALSFVEALGDGQTFLGCADANTTVTAQANGTTLPVTALGANCVAGAKVVATGVTPITFDLGAALSGTFGPLLRGDLQNDATQAGPTTVTLKFRATIDTAYSANPFLGGGTPALSLGDSVANNATASGNVGGSVVSDGTSTSVPVGIGTFTKSVYAYNGIVPPPPGFLLGPGDTLTYRITTSLPFASFENGSVTDFLPLPFFDATSIAAAGVAPPGGGAAPPSGKWTIGPSDTFTTVPTVVHDVAPVVSTSASANSIVWNYGTFNTQNPNEVADLMFTVTATTRPFADNLNIANLAQSSYQNSTTVTSLSATVANITTKAPNVTIVKQILLPNTDTNCVAGVLPAGYDAAVVNCDAGDVINYRLVLTNAGRSPAYNVRIDDNRGLPATGFNSACTAPTVTDSAGNPVANSGNLYDLTANGGLTITTIPADTNGVVDPNEIIWVSYQCTISPLVPSSLAGGVINNTARLKYYSADAAQTTNALYNYAANQANPGPNARLARVTVRGVQSITKVITASSVPQTSVAGTGLAANINNGETLTFLITATLSEGTYSNFLLTDTTVAIPTPITCGSNGFTCSANVSVAANTPSAGQQTVTVTPTTASTPGIITYTYSSQKFATGNNIARVAATNVAQVSSATVNWTLVNPNQAVTKAFAPATADAGDTVTVNLGWSNSNSANSPMFQCVITDNLNAFGSIFDLTSVAAGTTPANYTFNYDNVTHVVSYTYADPAGPGGTTPCNTGVSPFASFTVKLLATAPTGGLITNTATISVNTLPPGQSGGATRTSTGTANLNLTAPSANTKVIQATSEAGTAGANIAIGEIVTYRVTFNIPDGITSGVTLVDEMQGTLANFGYVAGSARLSRNTLNTLAANTMTASANPGNINAAAQNAFVNVPVVCGDTVANACPGLPNEIHVLLGDVNNAQQAAGTSESYTLELQLQALNVAANVAAATRVNRGRLIYTASNGVVNTLNGGTVTATVVAPSVQTTKTVAPASGVGGGDTVTYTLTITNPVATGSATAYNWTFTDTLPADLQSPSIVTVVSPVGVATTAAFTGNVLNGTINQLAAGQSVVVTYKAQIKPTTPIGKTIVNAASSQTTTLPGPCGTNGNVAAPCSPLVPPATKLLGDPGTASGERTGAGGVNNLSAGANAPFTTNLLNVTKAIVSPKVFYAVGDIVQYQVSMAFPVGTATGVTLVDTLPVGMAFVPGSASTSVTGGPITPTLPGVPPVVAGQDLTFAFGNVTAANAGVLNVVYSAVVQNVVSNQNNTPLVNNARVTLTDPNAGTVITRTPPTLPTATVGEPNLIASKVIVSGDPGADAGNTVRWSVNLQNTGTTTAQRVDLKDVLPNGLYQISNVALTNPGNLVTLNGTATAVSTANVHVTTTTNAGDTLDVAALAPDGTDYISIPPTGQITVAFDSIVMNSVFAGQTLTNAISVPYASQPVCLDNAVCRDGSGAPLNDYVANATKSLTIASTISLDKQVSQPTAPVGATVTFTSKIGVIEGVTPQVRFKDVFPAGLTPISWTIGVGNMGMTFGNPSYATNLGTGRTVAFDLGDVGNPANGSGADDFVQIDIVARVDNIATNQNGIVLSNGDPVADLNGASLVTVMWGTPGTTITFDASPAPGIQGRPITVTEPELGVVKTVVPTLQALGDVVTYSVTVSHLGTSTANAFDVALADTLPVGLTFVLGSVNPPGAFAGIAGQVLSLNVGTLLLPQSTTITYQARVDNSAVVGAPITNNVQTTWASQPGATGAPDSGRTGSGGVNDYRATASTPMTPTAAAFIDAQKRVAIFTDADLSGSLTPGDTLQYTVTLTNTGPAVTNAVYADPIPTNTTYSAIPAPTTTAGSVTATTPVFTVNIGAMAAGQVVTIKFAVKVNPGTPAGTVISNQGSIDSDQTVPKPTDGDGIPENGDQPTEIVVAGGTPPPNALYAQKFVVLQADNDSSGTITQGDRMRYTIALQNTGGGTLTNVSFSDVIPAGLTYVAASATATAGTLAVAGANVNWTGIGSLAPGAQVTATFDVTITSVSGTSQTYVNQGTATSTETGPVLTDGNGNPSDGNQPTMFTAVGSGGTPQPALDLQKRWSIAIDTPPLGVASPGDTLQYSITVANNGSAPSLNTRVTDPVPTCTGALNPCTSYVAGSLVTSQGAVVGTSPVDVNLGTLAPGATATISFRVLVNAATANGVIVANQALATYTGGGPVPSDDNGNPGDGLNPTLTPISTGAGAAGVPGNLAKQLVGTSEPDAISAGNAVVIGEVARFDISASMPAGTTRHVTYLDTLPAGLAYLPGSARLSRTFDTGLNASANPGGVNSAASGTFVPLTDGASIIVSAGPGGTTLLSVYLGDVINSDNDANLELYTLEYRAVVQNVAGNQAATTLANAATVSFWNALSQTQTLTPAAVTLTVAEPVVTIAKTASPGALLTTGGATTYTITISNGAGANTSPAFDLVLNDPLPAPFTSVGARTITSSGAAGVVDMTSGTTMSATIARLDPGGSVTIAFLATAPGPVAAGALTNTASAAWTSLPGTNGSNADGVPTPGAPGTTTGERTGSGGVNDYAGNASAVVQVGSANITKSIVTPQARYAIGDAVTYQVDLAVPIGSFGNGLVTDVLPAGLNYVPGSLAVVYTGVSASTPPADFASAANTPGPGQTTLTAQFGTLTNAGPGPGNVRLTYKAVVANVLANQANTSLANSAAFSFSDPGSGEATVTRGPATTTLVVGEPFLALTKALLSSPVGLAAGSTASYTVSVGNTGTTTAFETVIGDALPAGLFFPGDAVVTVTPTNLSGNLQVPTVTVTASNWQSTPFDLPVGDSVVFSFTATLANTVQPGQSIQNGATGTYTSRDGADPNERDGSTPGSSQGDDSKLNNYNAAALAPTITVADPIAIDKTFTPNPAQNHYAIGQLVTYRLKVSLLEGTTRAVKVSDTLPAGLTYVASGAPGTAPGAPITFSYGGSPTVAGQTITFDLGDVVNAPDGNAANDFITIDLTAHVDNVIGSQDGTVLGNNANVSFVNALGATIVRDFDADAATLGIQPLDLIVIEPVVTLSKTAAPASVSLGDQVMFTLLLDHTAASHADAYDVTVTDTLPAGLTYVPGSASLAPVVSGQTLTFNVGTLTLAADNVTITFRAQVSASAAVGVPLTNNAGMTYASIPGATGAPDSGRNGSGAPLNDYVAASSANVTPNANAQIGALKTVAIVVDADGTGNLTPGDTLEWTIVLTNAGPAVTNVVFTDPIPANTTYVASSATTSAGTISATPSLVTANIGPMAASATAAVTFRTTVNAGVAPGTVLSNQGTVDSDQTVPTLTDNDGDPANGLNPTTIVVNGVPALTLVKSQSFPADANLDGALNAGEQIQYTLVVTSTGTAQALNVVLTDTVPANTTLLTATTTVGTVVGVAPVTVNIGTLAVGATATVTITVQVNGGTPPGTVIINQGTVNATGMSPVPSNTVTATVVAPPLVQTLAKNIAPATINFGGSAALTLTLGNVNAIALTLAAPFVDTFPAGMTASGANLGSCVGVAIAATAITMPAGATIPPGGCSIVVTVTSTTIGTVTNVTGTLATNAGTAPPASAPLTVNPVADVAIFKSIGVAQVVPGTVVTYTIVAHNYGPSDAIGATVVDNVPATLTGVTWTCVASAGSSCPPSGTGNINATVNLLNGGTATFTLTGTLAPSASGTLSNTATIAGPPGVLDPNPGNGSSTASTPIRGGGPSVPVPVDSPLALLLLGMLLALAGFSAQRLRRNERQRT